MTGAPPEITLASPSPTQVTGASFVPESAGVSTSVSLSAYTPFFTRTVQGDRSPAAFAARIFSSAWCGESPPGSTTSSPPATPSDATATQRNESFFMRDSLA